MQLGLFGLQGRRVALATVSETSPFPTPENVSWQQECNVGKSRQAAYRVRQPFSTANGTSMGGRTTFRQVPGGHTVLTIPSVTLCMPCIPALHCFNISVCRQACYGLAGRPLAADYAMSTTQDTCDTSSLTALQADHSFTRSTQLRVSSTSTYDRIIISYTDLFSMDLIAVELRLLKDDRSWPASPLFRDGCR